MGVFIQPIDPDNVNVIGGDMSVGPPTSTGEGPPPAQPDIVGRHAGVSPILRRAPRLQAMERLARDFESMERGY